MSETKRNVPKLRFPGFTEDWEQRKLKHVVELRGRIGFRGYTEKDIISKEQGGILTFSPTNIIDDQITFNCKNTYITKTKYDESPEIKIINGDILFVKTGSILGKSALVMGLLEDATINPQIVLMRPKEINPEFLANMMINNDSMVQVRRSKIGGAVPTLTETNIKEVDIFIPTEKDELNKIGNIFKNINQLITLHQRKLENLKLKKKALLQKLFPKNGEQIPELRFPGFTDDWEQRKLWELYERVNERNDGTLGRDKWISVAKMYFQDPDKVQSNNLDTRTYVMQRGDIAFEGHPNNEFKFGRFVLNDIGTGIISELFPIYRAIVEYDLNFWKYAIQLERTMAPIFAKSITSSGNSSNKLDQNHFLQQSITIPTVEEQKVIGSFLENISNLITLHQRKLEHLQLQKKALLQQMFV